MIWRWLSRAPAFAVLAILFAACGDSGALAVAPSATAATAPSAAVATPAAARFAWTVSDKSKATVRVREQLASLNLPSDAVLVASGAKGAFDLNADGTFVAGSQITFDVSSLTSDSPQRDNFVKQSVLASRQFPTATFVPSKTTGLTLPLASNGHLAFKLAGTLTIHGTAKDVTFDVDATRNGSSLTATATLSPTVKFEDFGMSQPAAPGRVLSVVDEIKMTIELVATGGV